MNSIVRRKQLDGAVPFGARSTLHEVVALAAAAFEIDGSDPVEVDRVERHQRRPRRGGQRPGLLRRIDELDLETWAPGFKEHWVRLRAVSASGRRIVRRLGLDYRV